MEVKDNTRAWEAIILAGTALASSNAAASGTMHELVGGCE